MSLATVTTLLRHRVRLLHASTREPIRAGSATLEPAVPGWSLLVRPDGVVVSARGDAREPAEPPFLVLTVGDPVMEKQLDLPPVEGQPPGTVVVPLTAAEIDVPLRSTPRRLTVVLTAASSGAPATGRDLLARARSGATPRPTLRFTEGEPGTYRSDLVEWPDTFTPADLVVGRRLLRVLSVSFSSTETRIHLVDTT
jgi:hypothetical protein